VLLKETGGVPNITNNRDYIHSRQSVTECPFVPETLEEFTPKINLALCKNNCNILNINS